MAVDTTKLFDSNGVSEFSDEAMKEIVREVDYLGKIDTALIAMSSGFSSATAKVVKNSVTSLVTILGAVISTTSASVGAEIGIIPSGYRLNATRKFMCNSSNGTVVISIGASGAIYLDTAVPNGTTIYLEGIVFATS